jgi:hypothetical protein
MLRIGGSDLALPGSIVVAPAGQLVVMFDGQGTAEGNVVHAASGVSLPADHGVIELLDKAGGRLDRIAWGNSEQGAVAAGPGGIVPAAFDAGTAIGRAPGTGTPADPTEWVVYSAADVSPGQANPVPTGQRPAADLWGDIRCRRCRPVLVSGSRRHVVPRPGSDGRRLQLASPRHHGDR